MDSAVTVLALTEGQQPLNELIALARDGSTANVKGQALFWLAQRAGQKAVGTITAAIDNDPDTEVKKKAVFALSQLPKDEGVPLLIEQARNNKNPAVRKQAMFWLGQSKDPRALKFFEEILTQALISRRPHFQPSGDLDPSKDSRSPRCVKPPF